jgi:hypothetical protein
MKRWNIRAALFASSALLVGAALIFALRMMPDWILKWIFGAVFGAFAAMIWKSLYDTFDGGEEEDKKES